MSIAIVVRHGHAAAGWDADPDPGLDDLGRRQAEAMAAHLAPRGPLSLVSSPLRRCRETADALGRRWGAEVIIDPAVGEIATPADVPLADRGAWLGGVMRGRWSQQESELVRWRDGVVAAVVRLVQEHGDVVIVSHYVALNALVGHARGDDAVIVFSPDNCSWTELQVDDGRIAVVALGQQATTIVT